MSPRAEAALAGARASYGVIQLAVPRWSAEQVLGGPLDPQTQRIVRVLGARQLTQAGLALAFPAGPLAGLGVGVDAMHALSMLPLAASSRWRRPALVSAAMATAFAVAGVLAARRVPGNTIFD